PGMPAVSSGAPSMTRLPSLAAAEVDADGVYVPVTACASSAGFAAASAAPLPSSAGVAASAFVLLSALAAFFSAGFPQPTVTTNKQHASPQTAAAKVTRN